ncbi:hypothetical protein EJ04DRAFT_294404 [Polyplosphaeria fusca]|uniref:Uncharacterized protein n=1 Tax=Polyplosphaeria fusca TaxID=682080 RepID=A0A9P4RAH5_9PLEO|nr:hypothetical protein EJ04DRAFT_294404 [Polyplosphaeria fusca]
MSNTHSFLSRLASMFSLLLRTCQYLFVTFHTGSIDIGFLITKLALYFGDFHRKNQIVYTHDRLATVDSGSGSRTLKRLSPVEERGTTWNNPDQESRVLHPSINGDSR